MNKFLIIILCLAVAFGLIACDPKKSLKSNTDSSNNYSQLSQNVSLESFVEESKIKISNAASAPSNHIENFSEKTGSHPSNFSETDPDKQKYQKLGEKLLKELKKNTASCLTFFDVANKLTYQGYEPIENVSKFQKIEPCAEIKNASKTTEFKKSLKLDQWKAGVMKLKSMPKVLIYFGHNFHINLEATDSTGKAWMSINSTSGSAYYTVPKDVYKTILQKYKDKM